MFRSYRYRLSPTRAQARTLDRWLGLTRELYNAALQERRDAWQKQRARVTAFDQQRALPGVREVRPEFGEIPIVVLRGAVRRLDRAFAGFFRRCKSGAKPGYPRFRGRGRFESILIDDIKKFPIVAGGDAVTYRLASPIPTPEEWLMAKESAAETWVREVPDLAAWAWEHYQPRPKRPAWINRPTVEEAVLAHRAQRLAEEVAEAACEGCAP